MRAVVLASLVMSTGLVVPARTPQAPPSSAAILAEARQALGGETRLNAVRTFRITGRIVRTSSRTSDYGSFELVAALPDKFLEIQEMRRVGSGQSASADLGSINPRSSSSVGFSAGGEDARIGFDGPRVIFEPRPATSRPVEISLPITADRLARVQAVARADFIEITLGLFATAFSGAPVTFADAPSLSSRAVLVQGTRPGVLRFDVRTHLPASLDELEYLDYRSVDGVQVPFRRRLRGTEWQVRDVKFDVPIPASTFRTAK